MPVPMERGPRFCPSELISKLHSKIKAPTWLDLHREEGQTMIGCMGRLFGAGIIVAGSLLFRSGVESGNPMTMVGGLGLVLAGVLVVSNVVLSKI